MPEEGKPTGIYEDGVLTDPQIVEFEGRRAQVWANNHLGDGTYCLKLDAFPGSGPRLALYGYYDRSGEFMEVDRERLD